MDKRAAIYLRVSSDDQTFANQRPDVERLAAQRGLDIVATFEETASAAKQRPEFDAMLRAAQRAEFSALVVWSLDRLGRSMVGNVAAVLELDRCGVTIVSVREPWLDTGGAVRPLLIAVFGWVAEQERESIIARTRAGMARARAAGARIGRPKVRVDVDALRELASQGLSVRAIAQRLHIKRSTIHRALTKGNP